MNKIVPQKEILIQLYIIEKLPIHKIAKQLNMSVGKVFNYIKLYQIPTRKNEFNFKGKKHSVLSLEKMSKAQKGKVLSVETKRKISEAHRKLNKGGIGAKKQRKDGYIAVYFPDHPKSTKDGYIMEHILVMECNIGRWIKENEVVHHKNHIRNDNRIENLELMTFSEHARLHMIERINRKKKGMMTY